jgi:hypothetical protein
MNDNSFGFGTKPSMKEVPAGQHATFTFVGEPELVETEWGEKYSFPINLISHSSYDTLPLKMTWQSKCQSAKQLFNGLTEHEGTIEGSFQKKLKKHFKESAWRLTRFDTGAYWLEVEQ